MNFKRFTVVLLSAVAVAACEKNAVQVITAPAAGSFVRFANFGISAPGLNFYANDTKLSAISSTTGVESTTGVAAGAFAITSGLYYSVVPGSYTLTGRIAAATDKDLTVATAPATLENGKFYTLYTAGTYSTTGKSMESFVVEDPIPTSIDAATAYVRYVNAVSGSQPSILYAKNQTAGSAEVTLGAAVAYKSAGAFTPLPAGVYDLNTRLPGSTTSIVSRTAVSFVGGRVYTVTVRATSATAFTLDNTANR